MGREDSIKGKSVGAVHNGLRILRYVSELGTPTGVNQIARTTGVSASSSFNILGTLVQEGLINFDHDTKTYSPGIGLLGLAIPLLPTNPIDLVTPEIEELSRKHNSLICLWNVTADERIVLSNRASSSTTVRVDMNLGARLPAYVGAVGRCYAALRNTPEKILRETFDKLHWQSPPRFEDYLLDIETARHCGFAFDFGNLFNGLEITASVVTDAMSRPRYGLSGISIAGQQSRAQIESLAKDIKRSADWIGTNLFGAPQVSR
ncbi:acetate operon repressor (plasmid) [Antarctobacter heliothermus]|uniref:Acetate operon repressor n=2 Tax=Antarctobacter heliothermus TaxID=74033 RepID=A0A222EBN3_9RHOB|nr:acetate operon repressor [Antarctobacter heliothermus]